MSFHWQAVLSLNKQRHDKEKVIADARDFAKTHSLGQYDELFGRAALVARDQDFTLIPELTEEEVAALQYEKDHKWHGTKMLWYSIGLCAVGAATQGKSHLAKLVANSRVGSDRIQRCEPVFPCGLWYRWARA